MYALLLLSFIVLTLSEQYRESTETLNLIIKDIINFQYDFNYKLEKIKNELKIVKEKINIDKNLQCKILIENEIEFEIEFEIKIENKNDFLMIQSNTKNIKIIYDNYLLNLDTNIFYKNIKVITIELIPPFDGGEFEIITKKTEKYISPLPKIIEILKTIFVNATLKFKGPSDILHQCNNLLWETTDFISNDLYVLK